MSAAVDPAYLHYPKYAEFRALVEAGGAALKLYHLAAADAPVPDDVAKLCADWFAEQARLERTLGSGLVPARRHVGVRAVRLGLSAGSGRGAPDLLCLGARDRRARERGVGPLSRVAARRCRAVALG